MVNLILQVILCGIAASFIIELIALALEVFVSKPTLYALFSMPIGFGLLYTFIAVDKIFFVLVPAVAFIASALNKWLNRPVQIQHNRLPRL